MLFDAMTAQNENMEPFLPKGWPGALAFNTALSHAVTQQQLKWKASLHPQTNYLRVPVCLLKIPLKSS